jgi:hypothetical protein
LISLGVIERVASNAMIAQRSAESEIGVMGSGFERVVEALWPLRDAEDEAPRQVSEIIEI